MRPSCDEPPNSCFAVRHCFAPNRARSRAAPTATASFAAAISAADKRRVDPSDTNSASRVSFRLSSGIEYSPRAPFRHSTQAICPKLEIVAQRPQYFRTAMASARP
jgi:hypothetical protein